MNKPAIDETNRPMTLPPWLTSVLMKRGDFLPRFVFFRQRLARRPRGWRRRLRRQLAVGVTGAALLLAMGGVQAQVEPAATDNVITVVNGQVGVAANGQCSLIEAIQNANNKQTGRPNADCAAGNPNGADTINLPANGLFTLTSAFLPDADVGPIGLPWISTAVTINGNGSTIERQSTAEPFRIMAVGQNGNLTLNNATIRGGSLYHQSNYYEFYNYSGGGIFNQGRLTITGSTIAENEAASGWYGGSGGGIYNSGTLTISSSTIRDNAAGGLYTGTGGGIDSNGTLTILDSTISDNVSGGRYSYGGGVFAWGSLTISNSKIQNNSASGRYSMAGGGVSADGVISITGSTFSGNSGGSGEAYFPDNYTAAGAIANFGAMTITNSTISNNENLDGGASVINFEDLAIINSTISGNTAGVMASCYYYDDGSTRFRRTVVSGNEDFEVMRDDRPSCASTVFANDFNLFGRNGNPGVTGFTPGPTDIIPTGNLASILSPLAANGGTTLTHALPAGSPARDRAPNTSCTAAPVNGVDQRGQPRNQNGAGGASANECDIGAFEAADSAPPATGAFFLSTATAGTVGGVPFAPADILKFTPGSGWSMHFDASDVGISKNVSAFEIQNDGSILLSLAAGQNVPGVGQVAPHDVIRFTPTQTGNTTAGAFQMWVDGSTVGLTTTGEKIDALSLTANGRLAISTTGALAVPGPSGTLKAQDEDAAGFMRTTGAWSAFFDGTPIPGLKAEDVNALWVDVMTGDLYVSIVGAFNLGGVSGDGKDIVKLTASGGGFTPSLFWDGSAAGFPSTIDGLEMVP